MALPAAFIPIHSIIKKHENQASIQRRLRHTRQSKREREKKLAVFRETGKPKTESKTAYERKLKRGIFLYSLFALLLIPFYTIKLATRADVMNYSISFVGNALGHRQSLMIWTAMSSLFFISFLCYLLTLMRQESSPAKGMIYVAGCTLIACNFVPSVPQFPVLGRYHNFLAMSASILLAATLFVFVATLRRFDEKIYKKALCLWMLIVTIPACLLIRFGVNSLLESISILLLCYFLFCALLWLLKSKAFHGARALAETEAEQAAERAKHLRKRAERKWEKAEKAAQKADRQTEKADRLYRQAGVAPFCGKRKSLQNKTEREREESGVVSCAKRKRGVK